MTLETQEKRGPGRPRKYDAVTGEPVQADQPITAETRMAYYRGMLNAIKRGRIFDGVRVHSCDFDAVYLYTAHPGNGDKSRCTSVAIVDFAKEYGVEPIYG